MGLKPNNLIQAAQADLRRRKRNIQRHELAQKGKTFEAHPMLEFYAFHAAHVRRAKSADHLIALAFKNPAVGQKSKKKNTRLIYGDLELLAEVCRIVTDIPDQSLPAREPSPGRGEAHEDHPQDG